MCDFNESNKCLNSPELFCYICGRLVWKKQRVAMTSTIQTAYKLYFGFKIRDQDKPWVPHKCCKTCGSALRSWLKKQRMSLKFAIPMIWSKPSNHIDDCYFCMIGRISYAPDRSKRLEYPNIPSAKRPIRHRCGLPVPVAPEWHKKKKNSAVEVIDIKEEREEEELTSVEMKLETEEHSLSHLELDDEDVTSSVDETSEHFPQTETARLYTKTEEEDHGTGSSRFFQAAPLENGDCFTRDSTGSCDRTDALDAGVLQDTGLAIPVITELNNRHTSSNESIHKKPVKRAYIPDFETEESKHLTTPELQRLLLIEQLKLTRLQTAFYEKRMKALSQ